MQLNQQPTPPKIFCRATPRQRLYAAAVFVSLAAFFGLFALTGRCKIPLSPFPCGFQQRFNLPCPTCGFTTSIKAFAQGKFLTSLSAQPAAAFVCFLMAISAVSAFLVAVFGIYSAVIARFVTGIKLKYVILALIVIIAVGWAFTLAKAFSAAGQN